MVRPASLTEWREHRALGRPVQVALEDHEPVVHIDALHVGSSACDGSHESAEGGAASSAPCRAGLGHDESVLEHLGLDEADSELAGGVGGAYEHGLPGAVEVPL